MSSDGNDLDWFCWELALSNDRDTMIKICKYLQDIGFEWVDKLSNISPNANSINILDKKNHIFIELQTIDNPLPIPLSKKYCIVNFSHEYANNESEYGKYMFRTYARDNRTFVLKPDIDSDMLSSESSGVLLSDYIDHYIKYYHMIVPFTPASVKAASYNVRIGSSIQRGNIVEAITDEKPFFEIKPHEAVLVRTMEHIHMPRFLIGRWNLRVSKVYDGLVWVGGIQIDPGWKGELWCPIYNLSKVPVRLELNEEFASIDFDKTSDYQEHKSIKYVKNRANPKHPGSGLEDLQIKSERFNRQLEKFQSTNFTLIGIIVAAIAILASFTQFPSIETAFKYYIDNTYDTKNDIKSIQNIPFYLVGFSVVASPIAIFLSIIAFLACFLLVRTHGLQREKDFDNTQ